MCQKKQKEATLRRTGVVLNKAPLPFEAAERTFSFLVRDSSLFSINSILKTNRSQFRFYLLNLFVKTIVLKCDAVIGVLFAAGVLFF